MLRGDVTAVELDPNRARELRENLRTLGRGDVTVVEADGTVRPCFFHRALGNIREKPLLAILNSEQALNFRERLDIASDPICRRCVCSLYLSQQDVL